MANEAVLIYETQLPIPMTCADGATIEKGAFLKLADPATVATTTADHDIFGGIAAEEKVASDGRTKISVYRGGIFRGVAGTGGVTAGAAIDLDSSTSAVNKLADAAVNSEVVVGISLETAAAGETFLFELRPTVMNLA